MENFEKLKNTVEYLRSEKGCPWDRAQTLDSYKKYIIEEVYELFDAIDRKDLLNISEEIGDLLLNLLLMATILKELGGAAIEEIVEGVNNKIISRHPHVFGENKEYEPSMAYERWVEEKKKNENKGLFTHIPLSVPSLVLAFLISKRADKIGFGFEDLPSLLKKIEEEIGELKEAISQNLKDRVTDELGDLLFSIVNLAVFLHIHPEEALHKTCTRFLKRLQFMEDSLSRDGKNFFNVSRETLEKLWEEAK